MAAEPFEAVVRKLACLAPLTAADRQALRALPHRIAKVPTNVHLVREGMAVEEWCFLIDGYACRHKLTSRGGRQIVSFHMAGDLDLQHLMLERADHNLQTITPAIVGWVSSKALRSLMQNSPAIGTALWRDTVIEASIYREWVLNVGRRNAKSRIAHLLCEFSVRQTAAGLPPANQISLPLTQEEIGDATGLTPVHVNRMLRELRGDGVLGLRNLTILDMDRLMEIGDFHPDYLHVGG